jgi:hypothetical protein
MGRFKSDGSREISAPMLLMRCTGVGADRPLSKRVIDCAKVCIGSLWKAFHSDPKLPLNVAETLCASEWVVDGEVE